MSLSSSAEEIANKRYYFHENEGWDNLALRVGREVARPESDPLRWQEKFSWVVGDMLFIPAGRTLRNAGRTKGSMLNCHVIPIGDSIEQIGDFYKDALILWKNGGGVGVNFSTLRPKGALVAGVGGDNGSSGPVSFLIAGDAIAETIESGGQRRAAGLCLMQVEHPDVEEFIDAKTVDGVLSYFNISVGINEDFLVAVEKKEDWGFKFAQQSYGSVKAKYLWDKIVNNMLQYAEPGLINYGYMTTNNSYYFDPVVATNPCGEAPLAPYDSCDLGSLVLPKFVTENGNTKWQLMEEVIKYAVRMLDNILDVNKYSIKQMDIKCHNSRRIGLGVMGLADYLFAKKVKYGSDASLKEIEKLFKFIRQATYQASVELSVEKGAFPKFDPVMFGKAKYVRKLPASLRMEIKDKGVRNVTSLAIAPTGTISLIPECVGGIEPLSYRAYKRVDRVSERIYIHPIYKKYIQDNLPIPKWLIDSTDLKPEDHFEIQAMVQNYVDGAVSKTILLPKNFTSTKFSKLLLEYIRDVKGVTAYRDGSKEGQILTPLTKTEAREYIEEGKETDIQDENDVKCSTETCEL